MNATPIGLDIGKVKAFLEKGQSGAGWINAGIYLIKKDLIASVAQNKPVSIEHEIFPLWAAKGILSGYEAEVRRFIDIGTPDSFAEAQEIMKD